MLLVLLSKLLALLQRDFLWKRGDQEKGQAALLVVLLLEVFSGFFLKGKRTERAEKLEEPSPGAEVRSGEFREGK